MTTTESMPSVLFVCVKNGGKSQMAATLMRHRAAQAHTQIAIHSAGTNPSHSINQLSEAVIAELGADMSGEIPQDIDRELLATVHRVIVLGDEARVEPVDGMTGTIEQWHIDEPAERDIDGAERMRLVRDDIDAHVQQLLAEQSVPTATNSSIARPSVLFVCVHNAGRSQMAAGYLRELSQGRIDVRSAGSEPASQLNPVAVEAMAEEGIDITEAVPNTLTSDAVQASDVVITMGCGDACSVYPGKRYEDWELDDPAGQGIEAVRPIRDDIKARIQHLINEVLVPADTQPQR